MESLGIPGESLGIPNESLGIPRESLGIPTESVGIPRESLGILWKCCNFIGFGGTKGAEWCNFIGLQPQGRHRPNGDPQARVQG